MTGYCIRIADFSIRVTTDDPALALSIDASLSEFRDATGSPDLEIDVQWADIHEFPAGRILFDSGSVWRVHSDPPGRTFSFAKGTGQRPYKTASFSGDWRRGTILMNRLELATQAPVDPLEYPLDELLVVHLLSRGSGVEIHSAGVVAPDGRGFLFAGESGAGKSTLSRLWLEVPGTTILSDDRVILRQDADSISMHGTPWHGEGRLVSRRSVPLSAVFFLRQEPGNRLEPLSPALAAAHLFSRAFPPFYDGAAIDSTLAFLDQVCSGVPAFELGFVPDAAAVEFVSRRDYARPRKTAGGRGRT